MCRAGASGETVAAILESHPWKRRYQDASLRKEKALHPATEEGAAKIGSKTQGGSMLNWALLFLIVALIAAVFGFGGVATAAAGIAKILFFVFLVIFLISLVMGLSRRGV
jgi:uncharacterized membrane protein YtjA (UPF0391 family)